MKLKVPKNSNYAAVVVQIKTIVQLENCDNVVAAQIMGNQVIVGKDVQVGDVGLYFPLETQLTDTYLSNNNLYKDAEQNKDKTKKGYFEKNGRIRCVKFRGNKSEGLFMPMESLSFVLKPSETLEIGQEFDELNGSILCQKYIVKAKGEPGVAGSKKQKIGKKAKSKLIENQFRFHDDTSMLFRNLHKIHPDDIISMAYKVHGTSSISAKLLCKKSLKWYETALQKLGVNIVDTHYDFIYSSRKVVKNADLRDTDNSFYTEDIWGITHNELKEFLQDGMTIYYEVVGFLPNGSYIQGPYDYGCDPCEHKNMIYRITYTNPSGKVFEFSVKQVRDWCKDRGLETVPQLYYGYAKDFYDEIVYDGSDETKIIGLFSDMDINGWRDSFLQKIKDKYNEKDCYICENRVPEEGCVIRIEKNEFEAYKAKSNRFYEFETKLLDKGESNIEDEN